MKSRAVIRVGLYLFCAATLCVTARAQSLLVVNQDDATLSIIDPNKGVQVAVVPEKIPGVHAHEVAATLDGRTAFLPIYGSSGVGQPGIDGHEMLVVDIASHKIVGDIDFGRGVRPHLPVLDPVHNLLYVTTELDNAVTIVDPRTRRIVGKVPTGQAQSHMLAISHDGRRGYTANVGPGTVSVLDLLGRKTIAVIPVATQVQRISISTDDRHVFTSDQRAPRLAVIDTATNKVAGWVPLPGTGYGTAATLAAGCGAFSE
ncbi:MAG TPA: cytochrome D1 domain-containing protein [Acidobacteriaceae bacterium]|jgi:DNA-binding beta-propeller fold protein YncE|nr:cytochrome D1 domain-containing protein [Acidobacteriaceae bacterium]